MDKFLKIIRTILYTSVIAVGVMLLVTLFPVEGNFQVKIVSSGSMEPDIKVGSIVVIKPQDEYGIGDVVTFGGNRRGDIPTTHRIVDSRISNGILLFTTKGDANDSVDANEIREQEVLGKVLFSIPFVGYVIDFARKPIGILIIIIIPALLIIYDEISKIIKEINKMKRKKRQADLENKE